VREPAVGVTFTEPAERGVGVGRAVEVESEVEALGAETPPRITCLPSEPRSRAEPVVACRAVIELLSALLGDVDTEPPRRRGMTACSTCGGSCLLRATQGVTSGSSPETRLPFASTRDAVRALIAAVG
jgi:hypothetical protein